MHSKFAVLDAKKYRTRSRHSTNLISLSPKREKLEINFEVMIISLVLVGSNRFPNLKSYGTEIPARTTITIHVEFKAMMYVLKS